MPTFKKNITQIHRCGHTITLPDDFYQRTGVSPETAASLASATDCPDCRGRAGAQPTTYIGVDLSGRAVRKPTIILPSTSKTPWEK